MKKLTALITLSTLDNNFPYHRSVVVTYRKRIYFKLNGHRVDEESLIAHAKSLALHYGFDNTFLVRRV